jgi:hypothetical protein
MKKLLTEVKRFVCLFDHSASRRRACRIIKRDVKSDVKSSARHRQPTKMSEILFDFNTNL